MSLPPLAQENRALVKAQALFRGYLTRKAYSQLIKKKRYRDILVEDILKNERSYVNNLSVIVKEYLTPLRNDPQKYGITKDEISGIFSNIESISYMHSNFLAQLEPFATRWSDSSMIGDTFLHYAPFLSQLAAFSQSRIAETVTKLRTERKAFNKFLRKAENQSNLMPLLSYMELPSQRVHIYEQWLKDLVRNTWEWHQDFDYLLRASREMRNVSEQIEKSKKIAQNQSVLTQIQHDLGGTYEVIVPNRELIMEGILMRIIPVKQLWVFLFNDVIVFAEKSLVGKLKFIESFPLTDVVLGESLSEFFFVSSASSSSVYRLSAGSPEEMFRWINAITATIEDAKKKKGLISEGPPPPQPQEATTKGPPPPKPDESTTKGPPPPKPHEMTTKGPPPPKPDEATTKGPPPPPKPQDATTKGHPPPKPDEATTKGPPPPQPQDATTKGPPPPKPHETTTKGPPPPKPHDTTKGPPPPQPQETTTKGPPPPKPHDTTTKGPPPPKPHEATTKGPPQPQEATTKGPPPPQPQEATTKGPPPPKPHEMTTKGPPPPQPQEATTKGPPPPKSQVATAKGPPPQKATTKSPKPQEASTEGPPPTLTTTTPTEVETLILEEDPSSPEPLPKASQHSTSQSLLADTRHHPEQRSFSSTTTSDPPGAPNLAFHPPDVVGSDLPSSSSSSASARLFNALWEQDSTVLAHVLKNGASVNGANADGLTPLCVAAQLGFLQGAIILVESGADVNMLSNEGESPLFSAARNGHAKVVKFLEGKGADYNAVTGPTRVSALMRACERGHFAVVEHLVRCKNIAIDAQEAAYGMTALFFAVARGHASIASKLLSFNANPNVTTWEHSTALLIASANGHADIVLELCKKHADAEVQDLAGETALHRAVLGGHLMVVLALVFVPPKPAVDIKNARNATPLFLACALGNVEILRVLIKAGADMNIKVTEQTPLAVALSQAHISVVLELLQRGVQHELEPQLVQTIVSGTCSNLLENNGSRQQFWFQCEDCNGIKSDARVCLSCAHVYHKEHTLKFHSFSYNTCNDNGAPPVPSHQVG